jgi:hypothetical protein
MGGSRMIQVDNDIVIALKSNKIKEFYAKIDLLDKDERVIEEITTKVIDGSINVSKEREIRRTFSMEVVNENNEYTWSVGGKIWLDKRIKLWIGVKVNGKFKFIPQGIFVLTDFSASSSYTGEKKASLSGSDKWSLLSGEPIGKFINQTTINTGTKISDAIKIIAKDGGIDKFIFDHCDVTVPFVLSYEMGDSRGKAIKELADLAVYSIYFDVNGYLCFRPQVDLETMPSVWTYDKSEYTLYAGSEKKLDHTDLYNKVLVIGGSSQTPTVTAIAVDDNPNSPTSIQQINERLFLFNNGSSDPLIHSQLLAQARADYELKNHLRIAERQTISLICNPLHEAEDVITLVEDWTNTNDKYELISFTIPLRVNATTTAEVWRIRQIGNR